MENRARMLGLAAVVIALSTAQAMPVADAGVASGDLDLESRDWRWVGRDGQPLPFADEEALLEFLRSAEVVGRKTLGQGRTRPQLLVLERDGVRARAVFHDIEVVKDRERLSSGEVVYHFRDSYRNNAAVYELSRLLGIPNVPPAVTRRLGRSRGSVQLWIEGAHTETERREQGTALSLEVHRRIQDMRVFDNLINNIDRNQGNMLYDSAGRFWMIDHTRSLSRSDKLPSPERVQLCSRGLLAAIRGLDEAVTRERLSPFLDTFELDALFRRRDQVVELVERKIAENGEEKILFSYE